MRAYTFTGVMVKPTDAVQGLNYRRLLLTAFFGGAMISSGLCLAPHLLLHLQILGLQRTLTVLQLSLYTCAAPVGHYWYQGLDYLFLQKCRWPQASVRFVLSKVCHTRSLYSCICHGMRPCVRCNDSAAICIAADGRDL